jgi:hypothetical protein
MPDQNIRFLVGVSKGVLIVSTTLGAKNGKFSLPFNGPMGQGYVITVTSPTVRFVIGMIKPASSHWFYKYLLWRLVTVIILYGMPTCGIATKTSFCCLISRPPQVAIRFVILTAHK